MWRSMSTPRNIIAIGLALFCPAYFGALPCVASKTAYLVADVRPRREPEPAVKPGAEVDEDVAVEVRHHHHVVQLRLLHELHRHVVDDAILELDLRKLLG